MQQFIRQIVDRKSIKSVFVPEEFGEMVEIIVLPIMKAKKTITESEAMMKLQEKTAFVNKVLADEKEDVWNDL